MPVKPELTEIEQDKLNIDPDFDFRDIAKRPMHDIGTDELGMFKWSGVYQQLQKGFFMIRLRTPGGLMTAEQLDRAADLAERYAQRQLCITTRQTLQFHWVRREDLYKIIEQMEEVGLSTRNACGDVTRNVVSCSLQGVCPHEIGDTRAMLQAIADDPELLNEQRNFPRKHKISVSGCGRACGQTLMNCQGWYPVKRFNEDGVEECGWKYHAGGGLGARPYMAKVIFDWVPEDLVLDVTRAAAEVFRRKGNRRVRAYARLKMVVDRLGADGFGQAVIRMLRERGIEGWHRLESSKNPAADVGLLYLDGQAVLPQRQQGYSVVRVMILRSELSPEDARRFAHWAKTYGNREIMFTNRQNLELRFVPDDRVPALLEEIHGAGYQTEGHERFPDMVACVGTTYCNLAVSDTPNTYFRLKKELSGDQALWKAVGPLRINMNGCPNSCAQHWIADIGLRGNRKGEEGGSEEGFGLFVGGGLDGAGHIARHVCDVTSEQTVPAIRQLLEGYLTARSGPDQTFRAFVRSHDEQELRALIGNLDRPEEENFSKNNRFKPVFEAAIMETKDSA